jgi:FHS family glucose/mannose:H+ symporter-like MFS transporter
MPGGWPGIAKMLKRGGAWLVYAGFFVNGIGVVLLGPMLPRLESAWGIGDSGGGALLAAQFLGMSLGTVLVLRAQRRAMTLAALCAWFGLICVAGLLRFGGTGAPVEAAAMAAMLVYGFGLGQAITALNLGAGADAEGRASRLSFGNAMWSVGAIVAPMLIAAALAGHALAGWLAALSLLFPAAWLWWLAPEFKVEEMVQESGSRGAGFGLVLLFSALMFFYGSAEACLSGWVTTFARRDGGAGLGVSPLSTSAFWFGVAGGRALAAVVLRRWRDRDALLVLVGGAAAASVGLVFGRSMGLISTWAALSGMMLGPVFAMLVAGSMNRGSSSRQTGLVLAMCGIGATAMPLVLGVVSQRIASLREALVLPGVCLLAMLLLVMGFVRDRAGASR